MTREAHNSGFAKQVPVIATDTTLPPTSSMEMLEKEGATVLVFSHDANLAGVIKNISTNRYPIRVINEWPDLVRLVGSGTGRIVLLDVDALTTSVDDALIELNRLADWLVIVIAAKQQQAQDFMRLWSERKIHRLLIKPAAVGISRLLLESAVARFIELRELHENTDAMEILPDFDEAVDRPWRKFLLTGAAFAAVLIGVVVIYFSGAFSGETERQSAAVIQQVEPISDSQQTGSLASPAPLSAPGAEPIKAADRALEDVPQASGQDNAQIAEDPALDPYADLLDLAAAAEVRGQYVEPVDDNALDYYRSILNLAPNHELAASRLAAILEDLFVTAEAALLSGELDAAEQTLAQIRRGDNESSRLHFLDEQLEQNRQTQAALMVAREAAARPQIAAPIVVESTASVPPAAASPAPALSDAAPDAEQSELQSMLTLARLRLSQGALVAPPGDSARDYLSRAADLDQSDAAVVDLGDELADDVLAAAELELANENLDLAEILLNTAREWGSASPALEGLSRALDQARSAQLQDEMTSLHAQALRRIEQGRLVEAEDSAAYFLGELRNLNADASLVADVERQLSSSLISGAQQAITQSDWENCEYYISALEAIGLAETTAGELRQAFAYAQRQADYLATVGQVSELSLRKANAPVYPRDALLREITGWVDLHFTVDLQGTTRDIDVIDSQPEGRFEEAAVSALAGYEFDPFEFDGEHYERRLRLRISFKLD